MNITSPSEIISIKSWGTDSWKNYSRAQSPQWYDSQILEEIIACLEQSAALIPIAQISSLANELQNVGRGEAFILQCGNCSENFIDCNETAIYHFLEILFQMASVLSSPLNRRVVKIGRIAGQYAKPRSNKTQMVNGVEIPVYRGDMINDFTPVPEKRKHDPARMLEGYFRSAQTLHFIDSFIAQSPSGLSQECAKKHAKVYTSHEALLLEYEQAMTRKDTKTGLYYDTSAHMLWVGDRTRQPDGAHIEFLRGISNPIGIKVGPDYQLHDILETIVRLNPENRPGKICLIPRLGAKNVKILLPPLIQAVTKHGYHVIWICDPMHGNTHFSETGEKIRRLDDILGEMESFFLIHKKHHTIPGGIHLELTADNVTECIWGKGRSWEKDCSSHYTSTCDPRLNQEQSLKTALFVAQLLKQ